MVQIAFRKIDSTPALKDYIHKKVAKFAKLVAYTMEVHVLVSLEKTLHCCELTCHAEHRELVAIAKTKNLYESIDAAVHKIESQLKKEREKRKGHARAHQQKRSSSLKQAQDIEASVPHREKRLTE